MKKKGFTLIELLAVIVVLAIIALITIPMVINVIEKARINALKESVNGIVEASNLYYVKYMEEDPSFRVLEFNNGKQVDSYEKLQYKGQIKHGYVGISDKAEVAVCIDNGKYYATKALDSTAIEVEEGECTNEFSEELNSFVTVGSGNYIGLKLNVKEYASREDLPSSAKEGTIAVITNTKVTDYYVGPSQVPPTNVKDGMVWVILNNSVENYISTKNSKFGVAYTLQYISGEWQLKESYVYNDNEWIQLSYLNGSYTWDYDYTGKYQTFEAPYAGYYTIELWGASGGDANATYTGGNGAYTKGDIYLNAGEKLYVYVGQGGVLNGAATWNGGGTYNITGGSGGGATDVRTVATSTETSWNDSSSLQSRIMVAGAGGGGYERSGYHGKGGDAGGLIGYSGYNTNCGTIASGGTQTIAGTNISNDASGGFGYGATSKHYSGGGGSGWYGGGTGYNEQPGAGGSSYISGHDGCVSTSLDGTGVSITGKYFINTQMIDGQGYKWTNVKGQFIGVPSYSGSTQLSGNDGDGHARITFSKFASYTNEEYQNLFIDGKDVWRYSYSGNYQIFTAPKSGTYKFELWGASGGDADATYTGGNGAYTSGEMYVQKGTKLYIYVGQGGKLNGPVTWNGGGTFNITGGSGGGATDVRTVPSTSTTSWNETDSLKARIMVAAGGGGGYLRGSYHGNGGAAGGLIGYSGYNTNCGTIASGGTQTIAGTNISNDASGGFGYGATSKHYSGGGGSGWYGGGTGYNEQPGAGGSSYISGHNGCIGIESNLTPKSNSESYTGYKFTKTKIVDGLGFNWTTEKGEYVGITSPLYGTSNAGNDGDGYAKITFIK